MYLSKTPKAPGSQDSRGLVTFPQGNSVLGPPRHPERSQLPPRCLPVATQALDRTVTSQCKHTWRSEGDTPERISWCFRRARVWVCVV